MDKNTVLNGNKLIAKFMGFTSRATQTTAGSTAGSIEGYLLTNDFSKKAFDYDIPSVTYDDDGHRFIPELRFHKSWDWLIPVIYKIQLIQPYKLEIPVSEHYIKVIHIENTFQCLMDIKRTYKKVIEFIEWYNKNS